MSLRHPPLKKSSFHSPQTPDSAGRSLKSRSSFNGSLADSDFSKIPRPFLPRSCFERWHSLDVNLQPAPLTRLHSENIFRSTLFQTLAPKDKLEETLHQLKPFWALWWSETRENIRRNMINPNILNNLQSKRFLRAPRSTAHAEPAPLAFMPISQANSLKTNRPQNNGRKSKVRKGRRREVSERRARRIGKLTAISVCLILFKKIKRIRCSNGTAPSARPPEFTPVQLWSLERPQGSQHLRPVSTHKWLSTVLSTCNPNSQAWSDGVSRANCSQINKHLLSLCQLHPAGKSQCRISSISITSVTSWWQAGLWWVEQSDVLPGKRREYKQSGTVIIIIIMAPIYIKFIIARITKWAGVPVCVRQTPRQNSSSSAFRWCDPEQHSRPFWASVSHLLKMNNNLYFVRSFRGLNEWTSARHLHNITSNTSGRIVGIISSIFCYFN